MRRSLAAVGIEPKATLKARKLLILLNEKDAKNAESAQVRYTPGTRRSRQAVFGQPTESTLNSRLVVAQFRRILRPDFCFYGNMGPDEDRIDSWSWSINSSGHAKDERTH